MSSIYMLEQVINFNNSHPIYPDFFNKLTTRSSILFPSNIINCSLTIKDFMIVNSTVTPITVKTPDPSEVNSIGWGVENINHIGNQAFFTGWMQLLAFDSYSANIPEPHNSFLTVLAIAQCE